MHLFYINMQAFSSPFLFYFYSSSSFTRTSKHVQMWITMTTMPSSPSTVSGSAGVQQLNWGWGVCVAKPVYRPRPSEAAAPLERPGDRLRWAARRPSHAQPTGRPGVLVRRSSLAQDPALEDGWALQRWCIYCNGDGFWDFEKGCRNICIIPPSNICPLFTGMVSKLANHSSITGVTDCTHQTGGLLIGSCYDLANGEHTLNCEWQVDVQSEISRSPVREWNHCSAINMWAFRSLFSICSASMSVPGLSDLARCSQNHLHCYLDHRERRPPVGHWRTQPPCMGAAPEFRKAEVSTVHVIAPICLKV